MSDDLLSTTTVITMEKLLPGDLVYCQMERDGDHGDSVIVSFDIKPAIHFVGLRISNY